MESDTKVKSSINDSSDIARMLAALSFAIMLIVVGLPLWWKTTEVYRAPLPYSAIEDLNPQACRVFVSLFIYTRYPTMFNTLNRELSEFFESHELFKFEIKPFKLDLHEITIKETEEKFSLKPIKIGQLIIIEMDTLPNGQFILISNKRIVYITRDAPSKLLSEIILEWMFDSRALVAKATSLLSPGSSNDSSEVSLHRLKASLGYDTVFTIINSDPYHIRIKMDIKEAINNYIKPLLDQISLVGQHTAKSQRLYFVELSKLITSSEGKFIINFADLPHIITPLEKRLGSAVSIVPVLHFVLYATKCSESPLSFESMSGKMTTWMISPSWGGVQILNPNHLDCEQSLNSTTPFDLIVDSKAVMAMFVSQFHSLLGFSNHRKIDGVGFMPKRGPLLTDWQLDSLYRIRCLEQIVSASLTLQSLAKLLGEISNIVIDTSVASSVSSATTAVSRASSALATGELLSALRLSTDAFKESETAFSDPSLLALLYFPDDQKYAVYIPLFLPIMIPVLMSLKPIYAWLSACVIKN